MIESLDAVFYTAIFVLPGFIVNSIIDSTNPPKRFREFTYLLKCIIFSIMHCAIWSWLYKIVLESDLVSTPWFWLILVAISIVGASVLGLIISIFKQHNIVNRLLEKFKVKTIHPIPTAWDYYFSKLEPAFIIITLVDDTRLYGWYANESFASSDEEDGDIYVQKGYKVTDDGTWILDEYSAGFYVAKNQIKCIEIKKGENNE